MCVCGGGVVVVCLLAFECGGFDNTRTNKQSRKRKQYCEMRNEAVMMLRNVVVGKPNERGSLVKFELHADETAKLIRLPCSTSSTVLVVQYFIGRRKATSPQFV